MLFKEIPGNTFVKEQLIGSVKKNRVGHAQIFSGNFGSAKLALAFAYARYLNCEHKQEEDSCGNCPSCIKYDSLSHPDLHLIFPILKIRATKLAVSDSFVVKWRRFILENPYQSLHNWIDTFGAENNKTERGFIYKDDANLIHKKLALKNFEAFYRVVLIWAPEQMSSETSNKFLKLFEEPPSSTVFLLVSEKPTKLLPTILSRMQKTQVYNFKTKDLVAFFKPNGLKEEHIKNLVNQTNSNLGEMIQIIKEEDEAPDLFEDFSLWMRLVYKKDFIKVSQLVDSIVLAGRKHQKHFLLYAVKMIRECIIFNFGNKELLKINKKETLFISNFAPFVHEENTLIVVEKIEKAIESINRNANAKILLFDLSLQIMKVLKVKRKFANTLK